MLANPILHARMKDVGTLSLAGCMALGVTGPILRSTGLPYDVRKANPYSGYETYDFDVPVNDGADAWSRLLLRIEECYQSMRIVEQCLERLAKPGPVMVADKKVAWPAQLAIGTDGMGNSLDHIKEIMGTSMESLIHHFKLVTEASASPPRARCSRPSSTRAASWACTWCPTAAPSRTGRTSATRRSTTCRPSP